MLSSFARETVTRLRFPLVDDHGTPRHDYGATPVEVEVTGCWLEPIESATVVDGRLAVLTGYTVAAPPNSGFLASDHARYLGVEYEVTGDAMHVPSATGALDSTKFALRRWEG